MAEQLDIAAFQKDLDTLKNQRSLLQVKLSETVKKAGQLKETLKSYGYNSLAEAEEAYKQLVQEASVKHAQVKGLIEKINTAEAELPSKDDILKMFKVSDVAEIASQEAPTFKVPEPAPQGAPEGAITSEALSGLKISL